MTIVANFFRPRGDQWSFSIPFVDTTGAAYDFAGFHNVTPVGVLYLAPSLALSPIKLAVADISNGVVTFSADEGVTATALADSLPINAARIKPLPSRLHVYVLSPSGHRLTKRVFSLVVWDPATVDEGLIPQFIDTGANGLTITLPVYVNPLPNGPAPGSIGYGRAGFYVPL